MSGTTYAPPNRDDEDKPRKRGEAGKPQKAKLCQQFRAADHMTYELDCEGTSIILRMFPVQTSWRIELSALDVPVLTEATSTSRQLALQSIAAWWEEQRSARLFTQIDWPAVMTSLSIVRAI